MNIGAPASRLFAALVAFAGLSTSNSQAQAPAEFKWQELGARVFEQSCGVCHQPTGLGVPGAFPPLAGHVNPTIAVGAELTSRGHHVAWAGHASVVAPLLPQGAALLATDRARGAGDLRSIYERGQGLRGAEIGRAHV